MPLHELLGWPGPLTHRQFRTWQAWLQAEWNAPSRTDHYLMLIAQRVLQAAARNPGSVTLDGQRIEFRRRDGADEPPALTVEQATAIAKAKWGAAMGKR